MVLGFQGRDQFLTALLSPSGKAMSTHDALPGLEAEFPWQEPQLLPVMVQASRPAAAPRSSPLLQVRPLAAASLGLTHQE